MGVGEPDCSSSVQIVERRLEALSKLSRGILRRDSALTRILYKTCILRYYEPYLKWSLNG